MCTSFMPEMESKVESPTPQQFGIANEDFCACEMFHKSLQCREIGILLSNNQR
jgi:hypothetical protein